MPTRSVGRTQYRTTSARLGTASEAAESAREQASNETESSSQLIMTTYRLSVDDELWDAYRRTVPSDQRLGDPLEEEVARRVLEQTDDPRVREQAKRVLEADDGV